MPEITPQQMDEYRTNRAISDALSRQMRFDKEPLCIKVKPRKYRSDKAVLVAPQEPLTNPPAAPSVGA